MPDGELLDALSTAAVESSLPLAYPLIGSPLRSAWAAPITDTSVDATTDEIASELQEALKS